MLTKARSETLPETCRNPIQTLVNFAPNFPKRVSLSRALSSSLASSSTIAASSPSSAVYLCGTICAECGQGRRFPKFHERIRAIILPFLPPAFIPLHRRVRARVSTHTHTNFRVTRAEHVRARGCTRRDNLLLPSAAILFLRWARRHKRGTSARNTRGVPS